MTQDARPQNQKGQTPVELQMGEKSEDPGDKRSEEMPSLDREPQNSNYVKWFQFLVLHATLEMSFTNPSQFSCLSPMGVLVDHPLQPKFI
jgi:hypothetical protein